MTDQPTTTSPETTMTETLPPLTAEHFRPGIVGVTDLPITQGEDGEHFGYGHLDPSAFADAANRIDNALGVEVGPHEEWRAGMVEHLWAVATTSGGPDMEFGFRYVEQDEPGAFPVTVLQ